jgi:polysaccharide deacetylase family protein (PEP-CTERM system associated)
MQPGDHGTLRRNALSVDVEDWNQLVEWKLTGSMPACSDRVVRQTTQMLETLERYGVRATFFVLAHVARAFPALVRAIHDGGHEVASHGWSHVLVYRQTRDEFARETRAAKALLEDTIGAPITGYRAAEFSVTRASLWALDVLAEQGFRYDSSIFPIEGRRYGIPDAPRAPFRLTTASGTDLVEVPLTVCEWAGRQWPVGGGGYFRLFPYTVTQRALARVNALGRPAVVYLHPYEFSREPLRVTGVPWRRRLAGARYTVFHNFNRQAYRRRFERLLADFEFGPIAGLLQHGHQNAAVL